MRLNTFVYLGSAGLLAIAVCVAPLTGAHASGSRNRTQDESPGRKPARYSAHRNEISLTRAVNGIDGNLQLKQENGDSILCVVDRRGRVKDSRTFDQPFDHMQLTDLYGSGTPTYIVAATLAPGPEMSYKALLVLVEVSRGKLHQLEAVDQDTKEREPITLFRSQKASWDLGPVDDGKGFNIFRIVCTSSGDGKEKSSNMEESPSLEKSSTIAYTSFCFDGSDWIKATREEKGFWDTGQGFPEYSKFPEVKQVKAQHELCGYYVSEESWIGSEIGEAGIDIIELDVFQQGSDLYIDFMIMRNPQGYVIGGVYKTTEKRKGNLEFTIPRDVRGNRARGRFTRSRGDYLLDLDLLRKTSAGADTAVLYKEWVIKKRENTPQKNRHPWSLEKQK